MDGMNNMSITGKIEKIFFDITKNKNLMARIYLDDGNLEGYVLFKNLYYAIILKKDDIITIEPNLNSIKVPNKYEEIYNSGNIIGMALQNTYNNFINTLCNLKFGEILNITEHEVKNKIKDFIDEDFKLKDFVLEGLEKSNSNYAKKIISELNIKKNLQTLNPMEEIDRISNKFYYRELKGYRIVKEEL